MSSRSPGLARSQFSVTDVDAMNFIGAVNMMINGKVLTIPVTKVMYQNLDEPRPAGGVVEHPDGSLQIIIDARLSEEAADKSLEAAMEEISRRVTLRVMN